MRRMALLHQRAVVRPSKLELLAAWLPTRPWYRGPAGPRLERVVSFRFDDPEGEVGVETLLVRADDGPLVQAPLTYRGAPLEGGDAWLVGTAEHTVLGPRWVYDACVDPVYVAALATTILTGGTQAEEFADVDGRILRREPSVSVRGSGDRAALDIGGASRVHDADPTLIVTDAFELAVRRILDGPTVPTAEGAFTLTATWNGQPTPLVLATARLR